MFVVTVSELNYNYFILIYEIQVYNVFYPLTSIILFLDLPVYGAHTVAVLGALRYKGIHAVVLLSCMTPCCPTTTCVYLFRYQMLESKIKPRKVIYPNSLSKLDTVMNVLRQFQLSLINKVNFVL